VLSNTTHRSTALSMSRNGSLALKAALRK
jgi:hypothetical protein